MNVRALELYALVLNSVLLTGLKLLFKPLSIGTSSEEITSKHGKMVNYAVSANHIYNFFVRLTRQNVLAFIKVKNMGDYKLYYHPLIFSEVLMTSDLWEIYVKRILTVAPDEVFVDVGAHIGIYAIPIAKKARRVIAFEPNKHSFELLTKNILLNHLTNITACNMAASKKRGSLSFRNGRDPVYSRIIDGDQSSDITVIGNAEGRDNNTYVTNTIDLDSMLLKEDRIDWIKIDVEGHELDVLEGAMQIIQMYKPKIIIELMSGNMQKMKTITLGFGYSIEHIYRDYFLLKPVLYGS